MHVELHYYYPDFSTLYRLLCVVCPLKKRQTVEAPASEKKKSIRGLVNDNQGGNNQLTRELYYYEYYYWSWSYVEYVYY